MSTSTEPLIESSSISRRTEATTSLTSSTVGGGGAISAGVLVSSARRTASVATVWGHTQLMRTPFVVPKRRRQPDHRGLRDGDSTPAYGSLPSAADDETLTTQPARAASAGSACWIASMTESRLSSSAARQSSFAGYVERSSRPRCSRARRGRTAARPLQSTIRRAVAGRLRSTRMSAPSRSAIATRARGTADRRRSLRRCRPPLR